MKGPAMSTAPQMIAVQSSMFAAVGYSELTEEFFAQYNTGTLGAFGPTTRDEFNAVLAAPSIGVAFNKLIKPTKKYRKVEAEDKQPIPVELQKRGLNDGPPNSIIQHSNLYTSPTIESSIYNHSGKTV